MKAGTATPEAPLGRPTRNPNRVARVGTTDAEPHSDQCGSGPTSGRRKAVDASCPRSSITATGGAGPTQTAGRWLGDHQEDPAHLLDQLIAAEPPTFEKGKVSWS